jgi:hypothetical protein
MMNIELETGLYAGAIIKCVIPKARVFTSGPRDLLRKNGSYLWKCSFVTDCANPSAAKQERCALPNNSLSTS